MSCDCASDWRIEVIDLSTGERISNALPFVSFTFDDLLNQVGAGQIVVPVRKVRLGDIWPHLRALVFLRTSGPFASRTSPVIENIAMIETLSAVSDGTVTIGVQSIDHYLNYRVIKSDQSYSVGQNNLGVALVGLAASNGIPLTASSASAGTTRSRDYAEAEDPVIGTAISELTEMDSGPDYLRQYSYAAGAYSTNLLFTDYAGDTTPLPLNAKRGLSSYGIEIDATKHTNWVLGRGQDITPIVTDTTGTSIYPEFDKAVQWSDVTQDAILQANVDGEIVNNADPTTVPDVTISDLNISAAIGLGDSRRLRMNHGAIQYDGVVRVIGKSWAVADEAPTTCTLSMVPLDDVSAAILAAPISTLPACC